MNAIQKIKVVWKNKRKILEGIWNTWFPNDFVKRVAKKRLEICKSNKCGFYDKNGSMETAFIKGQPACGGCGCKLSYKSKSLSSYCYLKDIGKKPLWDSIMSQEEEDNFRSKTRIKNE